MTAADWPASTDPHALLRHIIRGPALLRWVPFYRPPALPAGKLWQLVHTIDDLRVTDRHPLLGPFWQVSPGDPTGEAATRALAAVQSVLPVTGLFGGVLQELLMAVVAGERANPPLADAVRCLIGDPFHPIHDATTWRTATAVAIATGIVADAAFDRLPVLADALEDGGCDHAPLLSHLRGDSPHQPGCHALDVVLGRA